MGAQEWMDALTVEEHLDHSTRSATPESSSRPNGEHSEPWK
jgi:hypothetical protein